MKLSTLVPLLALAACSGRGLFDDALVIGGADALAVGTSQTTSSTTSSTSVTTTSTSTSSTSTTSADGGAGGATTTSTSASPGGGGPGGAGGSTTTTTTTTTDSTTTATCDRVLCPDGSCVSTADDMNNCGMCGNVCDPHGDGGWRCNAGNCEHNCAFTGQTNCAGTCCPLDKPVCAEGGCAPLAM